jgi:hypothetical protein
MSLRVGGIVLAISGVIVSLFLSITFGLIIAGLGLIVISLNKQESKIESKVDETKSLKSTQFDYFTWSKKKFNRFAFIVDLVVITVFSLVALALTFAIFAYVTSNSNIEYIQNINCGTSVLLTDYILEPVFKYSGMFEKFCR